MNLLKSVEIRRVMNGVVAGTSVQTSTVIDTQGYDGVLIVAAYGVVSATAVTVLKAQQSSDDAATDAYDDLASSALTQLVATTDNNKTHALDIYRPQKRYLKAIVTRATGNVVIDGVFAILYKSSKKPISQGTTVQSNKVLVSPAEGTA